MRKDRKSSQESLRENQGQLIPTEGSQDEDKMILSTVGRDGT